MPDWVAVGNRILNVDNIELIERKSMGKVHIHMGSGAVIEITNMAALELWKYIDSERLKFLDLENPTRDFSAT